MTLTVRGRGGEARLGHQDREVDDLLIASLGDSIASGEGNPDIQGPSRRVGAQACHRSSYAGPAQAARWLETAMRTRR